jgi:S-adenosylmethionine/arginine decarboxylase-like enzyme
MISADYLATFCSVAARSVGYTVIDARAHQLGLAGAHVEVTLSSARVAIFTRPESGDVTVDLFVLNGEPLNVSTAVAFWIILKDAFVPRVGPMLIVKSGTQLPAGRSTRLPAVATNLRRAELRNATTVSVA